MIRNHFIAAAMAVSMLGAAQAGAEERDPFQPFGAAPTVTTAAPVSNDESAQARQSLLSYPLDSFTLVGVLVAQDQALAVLQGRDAKDYIVTTGDAVGKEGGKIETIRKEGITVVIGDNKMDMPVSNKVEKVNDKKDKK